MSGLSDDRPEAQPPGLRRYVTILFSDLSGSSQLGDVMEAEHYVDMLGVVRSLCREIILKHGGSVARLQGDGVLAVFGFPESREDDGRRAAEAALELHEAVGRIALAGHSLATRVLALHSGIHAGLTFVRSGDADVGSLEVLGEVPNTAANLSSQAQRGAIVISAETLGPAVRFFDIAEQRVLQIKGRSRPIEVFQVLKRRPAQRPFEARAVRGLAPFVGRDAELGMLLGCLHAAVAGEPQCVAVLGGPGLGKTRLVEEAMHAARAAKCRVLHGYCESYLTAEPMQPFLQILRAVFGLKPETTPAASLAMAERVLAALPSLSAEMRAELLRALSLGASPAGRRPEIGATIDAVTALVDAFASKAPVLLVLDDWQWADDLSQRVLDGVLALRRPVFVLVASRVDGSEGVLPASAQPIELGPLDLDQTRRSLEHLLPGADPFVVAEIHRYAGGVPLFVEELCHSAAAQGHERLPSQRVTSAAWMASLIESRMNRLPAEQRELVVAAAVIGNVFPSWLLERITGHGQDAAVVRALAAQDFIFPSEQEGMMRFKHGVTRDVIYQIVGLKERNALHLRVAKSILAREAENPKEDSLEALAYHFAAAGVPEQAAHFAELAGDKAMAAFALDRARAQYQAALVAMDASAPLSRPARLAWCGLAEKLGMACVWDPLALPEGVSIFERGVAYAGEADNAHALARAEYWLGYIHYAKGSSREALRHGERSLVLAKQVGDERLVAQVHATLGQALASAARYDRALEELSLGLDSKRSRGRPGSSIAVGSAYALACKGSVLGDQGRFVEAEACFTEAMALVGDTHHQVGSSVRNWISAVYQWQGRWVEAEQIAEASIEIAEHCKSRQLLAMSRALWGHAHWRATGRQAGLQTVLDATRWIEDRRGSLVTSLNYGWLVDAAVEEGRLVEARRHAARLIQRARQGDRLGEAMGCRALARAAALTGDFAAAERYLDRAAASSRLRQSGHEHAINQLARAELAMARDQRSAARVQLDEALAAFGAMAMPWHLERAQALHRAV